MKGRITFEGEQTVDLEDDSYEVVYEVTADCWYQPAKLGGPPEDCYPEEGELDIVEFKITLIINSGGEHINSQELTKQCRAELDMDQIEEKVWERFMQDS